MAPILNILIVYIIKILSLEFIQLFIDILNLNIKRLLLLLQLLLKVFLLEAVVNLLSHLKFNIVENEEGLGGLAHSTNCLNTLFVFKPLLILLDQHVLVLDQGLQFLVHCIVVFVVEFQRGVSVELIQNHLVLQLPIDLVELVCFLEVTILLRGYVSLYRVFDLREMLVYLLLNIVNSLLQ